MLGVTRPKLSVVQANLQRAGLITYTRGQLQILDRSALEARACECYGRSKREFDRLLGEAPRRTPRAARFGPRRTRDLSAMGERRTK